jgi:flagellar basal-body rod modification protein FlgD
MDPISAPFAAATSAQPGIATRDAESALSGDFETFLVMLTTQMKNQDPLDPMESSDFAVQLATFSGVEQQVRSNDLLADLGEQFGVMNLGQLAGWVGMDVRSSAPQSFSGQPLNLFMSVPATADRAELVVSDAYGRVVQRQDFDPSAGTLSWAGVAEGGLALPSGLYSFAVQPYANDAPLDLQTAEAFSRVTEVRMERGQAVLVLAGGVIQPADAITALREGAN